MLQYEDLNINLTMQELETNCNAKRYDLKEKRAKPKNEKGTSHVNLPQS